MLILYRKKGDAIVIGDNITVSVVESGTDGVRLAIDAPREVSIMRKELMDAANANREALKADAKPNMDTVKKMSALLKKRER